MKSRGFHADDEGAQQRNEMKLATVDEALASAGLVDRAGSNTGMIDAALETATSQLSTSIGTSFNRVEYTDYFGRNLINKGDANYPEFVCNLTQGFLDPNETPKVYMADSEAVAEAGIGIVKVNDDNVTKLNNLRYSFDMQKGRVIVYRIDILRTLRRALAVRYICGFEETEKDSGIYQGVPEVLKQAAIMSALRILRITPAPKPKINDRASKDELGRVAASSYASLVRSFLQGAYPESAELRMV